MIRLGFYPQDVSFQERTHQKLCILNEALVSQPSSSSSIYLLSFLAQCITPGTFFLIIRSCSHKCSLEKARGGGAHTGLWARIVKLYSKASTCSTFLLRRCAHRLFSLAALRHYQNRLCCCLGCTGHSTRPTYPWRSGYVPSYPQIPQVISVPLSSHPSPTGLQGNTFVWICSCLETSLPLRVQLGLCHNWQRHALYRRENSCGCTAAVAKELTHAAWRLQTAPGAWRSGARCRCLPFLWESPSGLPSPSLACNKGPPHQ